MLKDQIRQCIYCEAQYKPTAARQKTCSQPCSKKLRLANTAKFQQTDKWKEYYKEYNLARKESNSEYQKEYLKKHRDRINARVQAAHAKDPSKRRMYDANRRYETWGTFFAGLLTRRRSKYLSKTDLINLLEKQDYKCAISGLTLTKDRGSIHNASIDRIEAGLEYNLDNIQLICKCINNWRSNTPLEDFINLCKIIAKNNE